MSRSRSLAVVATLLFVAACGQMDESTAPSSESGPASAPELATSRELGPLNARVHVMAPKARNWDAFARPGGGGGGGKKVNTGINYHNGPILPVVRVAAIYWGTSTMYPGGPTPGTTGSGAQDGSLIGTFLRGLGASPYWQIETDYYDLVTGAQRFVPGAVSYTGFWAANQNPGSTVSDGAIQAQIVAGFTSGALSYDPSTIYAVFSGPGVNLGGGFGTQYCAYHGAFTWNGNVVVYAAQPFNAGVSGCQVQSTGPNADPADAEVNTLAHEVDEAATDPQLNAWYDRRGYENADKCAWTFGSTYSVSNGAQANMVVGGKNFLVQQNWLNRGSGGCALSL
jgi:Phosphate-induced protein 1 conserved region